MSVASAESSAYPTSPASAYADDDGDRTPVVLPRPRPPRRTATTATAVAPAESSSYSPSPASAYADDDGDIGCRWCCLGHGHGRSEGGRKGKGNVGGVSRVVILPHLASVGLR